ncbi:hypothetical protein [Ilumatobacter nonamiensis]|uniref:hypothetical protein n=1 Tax=Ilumatobacter nonamiensis TaxID=467093 RepID=UPI00187D9AB2|nr:hypothetical protein [Ilumatobacter nonamiensis]
MNSKISVANLVMLAGAAVTLLFSFFGFYKFGDESFSAWSTDALAFVTTIPAILAIAMIAWVGCELFGVNLPDNVLTFDSNQLKATWGISAAGIMLAFITTDGDKSAFFWLQLLGSFAMAAGSVMALLGMGSETVNLPSTSSSSAPQQPGQAPPPAGRQPPPPQGQPQQPPPPPAPGSNPPPPPPAQ